MGQIQLFKHKVLTGLVINIFSVASRRSQKLQQCECMILVSWLKGRLKNGKLQPTKPKKVYKHLLD